ncbi:MAG: Cj0069 family protein [Candidatus Binataceae bacterium]
METDHIAKIALLWRGNPNTPEQPTARNNRLHLLFDALANLNVAAEPVVYSDEIVNDVRERLLQFDGVLVWVDPITEGRDRSKLDPMLRDVASRWVWVSAHPDIILKMGSKDVLFKTRHLGWGTDTCLYQTIEEFREQFPVRLALSGPRVLKQKRGNGGIGTWKVALAGRRPDQPVVDPAVFVQEARMGGAREKLPLSEFMRRCENYFSGSGCIIDQAFQQRVAEGMIRCYVVLNKVVGFSTQSPRTEPSTSQSLAPFAMAREKTMYDESAPQFQVLRKNMESEWVPTMQRLLAIDTSSLPALWDADFLYGPKTERGGDTYVLGEINVGAVFHFPETAVRIIAHAAVIRVLAARTAHEAAR